MQKQTELEKREIKLMQAAQVAVRCKIPIEKVDSSELPSEEKEFLKGVHGALSRFEEKIRKKVGKF